MSTSFDLSSYHLVRKLGQGGYGSAYLYESSDRSKPRVVVKKMKIEGKLDISTLEAETNTAPLLKSQYLVRVYDSFLEPTQNGEMYCNSVMEYCDGKTLSDRLGDKSHPMTQDELLEVMAHLLLALKYLNDQGLIHRDVKHQNLMKSGRFWKLGDFGMLAKQSLIDGNLDTRAGTPDFVAPEIFLRRQASHSSDVFAAGVTFMIIILGTNPYKKHIYGGALGRPPTLVRGPDGRLQIAHDLECIQIPFVVDWGNASTKFDQSILDLVAKMMSFDPNERPTAKAALELPILKEYMKEHGIFADPPTKPSDSLTTIAQLRARIRQLERENERLLTQYRVLRSLLSETDTSGRVNSEMFRTTSVRSLTTTTLERSMLEFRKPRCIETNQEAISRGPGFLPTPPSVSNIARIRLLESPKRFQLDARYRTVAMISLEIKRKIWEFGFRVHPSTSPINRPEVEPGNTDPNNHLEMQVKHEITLGCDGPSVGICDAAKVDLFLNHQRLFGEETAEDLDFENISQNGLLTEEDKKQMNQANIPHVAGIFSVVYYQSGCVKHGNTVITPDGKIYDTLTNNDPIDTGIKGNRNWDSTNLVKVQIDMKSRKMVFVVDNVRQPVVISNLPASIFVAANLTGINSRVDFNQSDITSFTLPEDPRLAVDSLNPLRIVYGNQPNDLNWLNPASPLFDALSLSQSSTQSSPNSLLPPLAAHSEAALHRALASAGISPQQYDAATTVEVSGKEVTWVKPLPATVAINRVFTTGTHRIVFCIQDGTELARKEFEEEAANPHPSSSGSRAAASEQKPTSVDEAVRRVIGRDQWTPVIGGFDADQVPSGQLPDCLGGHSFSFGLYQNGLLASNGKYISTQRRFNMTSWVTLDLDMNNHQCFFYINDEAVPAYVTQLPNAVYIAASLSTKTSKVTVVSYSDSPMLFHPIPRNSQALPFDWNPRLPSFSAIPSEIVATTPSVPSAENAQGAIASHPTMATAVWEAHGNATIEQRSAFFSNLPFLQRNEQPDPRIVHHVDLELSWPLDADRYKTNTTLTTSTLPGQALQLRAQAWDAFFGIAAAQRTVTLQNADLLSPGLSAREGERGVHAAAPNTASAVPGGFDSESLILTRSGAVIYNNQVQNVGVGFGENFFLSRLHRTMPKDYVMPVAIEVCFAIHEARLIVGPPGTEIVAVQIKDIPNGIRNIVGAGLKGVHWQMAQVKALRQFSCEPSPYTSSITWSKEPPTMLQIRDFPKPPVPEGFLEAQPSTQAPLQSLLSALPEHPPPQTDADVTDFTLVSEDLRNTLAKKQFTDVNGVTYPEHILNTGTFCSSYVNRTVSLGESVLATFRVAFPQSIIKPTTHSQNIMPTAVGVVLIPSEEPTSPKLAQYRSFYEHMPIGLHTRSVGIRLDRGILANGEQYTSIHPLDILNDVLAVENTDYVADVSVQVSCIEAAQILEEWREVSTKSNITSWIQQYQEMMKKGDKGSHVLRVQFMLGRTQLSQVYFVDASAALIGCTFGAPGVRCSLTRWESTRTIQPREIRYHPLDREFPNFSLRGAFVSLHDRLNYSPGSNLYHQFYLYRSVVYDQNKLSTGVLFDSAMCLQSPSMLPVIFPGLGWRVSSGPGHRYWRVTFTFALPPPSTPSSSSASAGWTATVGFGITSRIKHDPQGYAAPFGSNPHSIGYSSTGQLFQNGRPLPVTPFSPYSPVVMEIDMSNKTASFFVGGKPANFVISGINFSKDITLACSLPQPDSLVYVDAYHIDRPTPLPQTLTVISWAG